MPPSVMLAMKPAGAEVRVPGASHRASTSGTNCASVKNATKPARTCETRPRFTRALLRGSSCSATKEARRTRGAVAWSSAPETRREHGEQRQQLEPAEDHLEAHDELGPGCEVAVAAERADVRTDHLDRLPQRRKAARDRVGMHGGHGRTAAG